MLKKAESPESDSPTSADAESIALILQQAGKSADEIAALATLDDADRTAEGQFSGEAPTIASLFGTGKAHEFHAGSFAPSVEVATCMGRCIDFLLSRKKEKSLLDNERMLFRKDIIS